MKELKGTEKQVKWGNDIRCMIIELQTIFNDCVKSQGDEILKRFNEYKREDNKISFDMIYERFNKILDCENAKVLIDVYSGLKRYMVERCKTKYECASLPVEYFNVCKEIFMVIEKF